MSLDRRDQIKRDNTETGGAYLRKGAAAPSLADISDT